MNEVMEKEEQKISKGQDIILERKRKIAFLDLLLQAKQNDGSGLSNSDIREEVDTFMFEGHDTTACSLAWTIFLIGHYPKVLCTKISQKDICREYNYYKGQKWYI